MKIKYSVILMWLLILSPIMDNINGYLLLSHKNSNISVIFKTLIFLFCLIISFKNTTEKKAIKMICLMVWFILQLIVFESNYNGSLNYDISTIIKMLTPIVIVMAVYNLKSYDRTVIVYIDKVAKFYCCFFPLSIIIPTVFHIGYATYDSGEGSKGFYYAGNEIAIIMVIIFALELTKYKKNKTKINFFNIILGIMSLLFIGTKSAYISLIILILVALYSEKNINKKFLNAILLIPAIFIGLWYVINNVDTITQSIDAIMWRYRTSSARGISFLFSGRELRIKKAIELVYGKTMVRSILLGIGPNNAENKLRVLIEMDLFDLFIRFGIVVFAIITNFYINYIKKVIQTGQMLYIVGVCLVYGASVFAGHMIFAPMVSIVLVVYLLSAEFQVEMSNFRKQE